MRWIKVVSSVALAATALCAAMPASAGKIYLMGGGYADKNIDLWVNGLRKATGKDLSFLPNVNSITNCSTDWSVTTCPRIAIVTSAKDSSYFDSANVFNAYETSKSLTRLVDQSAAANIGSASAPVNSSNPKYPSSAPVIKVKFTKDASTKGHYSGGKYIVVKALVQIY